MKSHCPICGEPFNLFDRISQPSSCAACSKAGRTAPPQVSTAAEEVPLVGGLALESEDDSTPQSPKAQSEKNATRSSNDLNRVVKVQLRSFGNLAMDASALLANAIAKENANGWRVIQVIPDDKSDETLSDQILRLITLGFYKKQNGYILILGQ